MHGTSRPIPASFKHRRWHSIMGLWLVVYLIFHLLANSQAALWVGDDGSGFVKAANDIRNLPYLPVIEIVLLAIPFLIHIVWGIERLRSAKLNSFPTEGITPALPEYPRNQTYTWQRITSWILLVLIAAHVIHMRFLEQPAVARKGPDEFFMIKVNADPGLYPLAERLGVKLYDQKNIQREMQQEHKTASSTDLGSELLAEQHANEQAQWVKALTYKPIDSGEVIAVTNNYGTSLLLMVRETFKMPVMLILYTVLVLSACFHGFNGFWTFCITWGFTLSPRSQIMMRRFSTILMILVTFLGLAAIWGTYWINLRQ